jgi:hypothetical protein
MRINRLTLIKHLLLTLVAMLSFVAAAASAAQAENGPFWSIKEGAEAGRLGAGATKELTGKAVTNQVLSAGGKVVTCEGIEPEAGFKIIGEASGESGKAEGKLRYSKCTVAGNGTGCKVVKEEVVTNALKGELVEDAAAKKKLLVDFLPASGNTFFELKFEGSGCTFKSTKWTGIDILDEVQTEAGKAIELGGESPGSAKSWRLEIETPQPTAFWLIKEGTGKEVKISSEEKLESFGSAATLMGTLSISLKNELEWSPLA